MSDLPIVATATDNPASAYLNGLSPTGARAQRSALRAIAVLLGYMTPFEVPWRDLAPGQVRELRARLRTLYAGATANRMLAGLRGVLRQALGEPLPPALVVELITHEVAGPPVGRTLSVSELGRLFAAARPTAAGLRDAAMVATMAGAGLRRDSIAKLDVGDYAGGVIRARRAKGGKTYDVPLHPGLRPILERWCEVRGGDLGPLFVRLWRGRPTAFRLSTTAVSAAIEALRQAAGVDPFTPHDLRRTFASALLDSGADLAATARVLGHSDAKTTLRYDRRGTDRMGEIVGKAHLTPSEPKS